MSKLDKVKKYAEKGKEDKLIALANDSDKEVRIAAIHGLASIGKEDSFNALIHMMDDSDTDIKISVIEALGNSHSSYADTHLRYALAHETDAKIQDAIRKALAALKESV